MKVLATYSPDPSLPFLQQEAAFLDRIALRKADNESQYERDNRQYTLSDKMTPGLGYDDRLTSRLNLSKNTIKKYIESGQLAAKKLEGKVIVLEKSVRRFVAPVFCVDSLPNLTGRINTAQLAEVETKHLPAFAVRLAAESDLCRRAHEIVEEDPALADETRYVVHKELHRRATKTSVNA